MRAVVSCGMTSEFDHHARIFSACEALPPLPTAVVHPCHPVSLAAAVEADRRGLIRATLFAPAERLRRIAAEAGIGIEHLALCDTPHSHGSAEMAVAAVRRGEQAALMKGSLHTDELMAPVVAREGGLRTARRISHAYVLDLPGRGEPLLISDAAVNILPGLEDKADIVQNVIDLAHALGLAGPLVAILSATESVNPKIPGTIEAAALCKMADRGQITGGLLDGPLALDNAIDLGAAAAKRIASPVAGRANVLIVPDLEAGNMLAKSLTFLAGAQAAGIVLGARVPIILTSRADSLATQLGSCAVAVLLAAARARQAAVA